MNQTHNGSVKFRVLSHTSGRLRLRILGSPKYRRRAVQQLARSLAERNDIRDFHVNPVTGSVTLLYEGDAETPDVVTMLAQAGIAADEPSADGVHRLEPAGMSETATGILGTVTQLDAMFSRATQRRLDLKSAVPLTLLGLAAWKIATQGIGWRQLSASTLLWYAYSTFKDLDVPRGAQAVRSNDE